jgi:apolipoprotein N-acyltransferase
VRWRALLPPRGVVAPALASAALFLAAFPPMPPVLAVLVCLVPLTVAAARLGDAGAPARDGVALGWWFGLFAYGATLYWIAIALSIYTKLAILGYFGALVVMAALSAGAMATLVVARRASRWPLAVLVPVTWVAWEKITEVLPQLGFPWLPLGLAVSPITVLAQSADLSGVHGLSLWIALINGLAADAWLLHRSRTPGSGRRAIVRLVDAVGVIALVTGYGSWRLETIRPRDAAPIAIVQPNVPQEDKWQAENQGRIVGMLSAGTRAALATRDAKLIVWPEVALPGYLRDHPEWRDTLIALGSAGHTPILFGVIDVEWYPRPGQPSDYDYFNAALLADSNGAVGAYPPTRKQYLVPVVERVPFLNPKWFGGLKYFGGYGKGHGAVTYALPWGKFGVLICYESIFPAQSRALRRNGADIILNITNDAWFGRSLAPWQHEAHMMLRAIETRAGVVRSANTGISSYIDPLGRIHGATGLFVPAARTYRAQTTDIRTLYVRVGDWIGWLAVAAAALLVLSPRLGRLRRDS